MKVAGITFVMAAVLVAVAMARPGAEDQAEEHFRALLEANDGVTYDRDDPESFAARNTRQNIRWTGVERGPTVLIGTNFPNKATCEARCREKDYPGVIFRNGMCRCRPPLMRVGVVE